MDEYWPGEGDPSFISHDSGETWHPLCGECGRELDRLNNGNSMANYECSNYEKHGLKLVLIWAEDWPDYFESEDDL